MVDLKFWVVKILARHLRRHGLRNHKQDKCCCRVYSIDKVAGRALHHPNHKSAEAAALQEGY